MCIENQYPVWLDKNKDSLSAKEFDNVKNQAECVYKIVACFERMPASESAGGGVAIKDIQKEIMDHLQKVCNAVDDLNYFSLSNALLMIVQMQEFGTPPESMIQELVPGYDAAQLDAVFGASK